MSDSPSLNFIEQIITHDIASDKHQGRVHTRFPPEPNGYLHIGHAKAICVNFEIAKKFGGKTNLRFDDTNPTTEDTEYVESIKRDINWLGFQWEGEALYASDYFEDLYNFAVQLIKKGLAYVDDSTPEEIAEMKGSPTQPGIDSPYKLRSTEENLALFASMRKGQYTDGEKVLRANIDMSSPNMLLRDPIIYRIKHEKHHRTGDKWCIYPMYDFAHGQSDSIEGITHSLCSLEFMHHRPLYDWFIQNLDIFPSRQIEFARMNVEYMITSKRKLLKLVTEKYVSGWDDPRMPTISGMRRRGFPPMAIRQFCDKAGVAKRENTIEINLLESCVREELNASALRAMVVLDPVLLEIVNYDEQMHESLQAENNPEDAAMGTRSISFSKFLFVEREDYLEEAPSKYFRMTPGAIVRLKHAYILQIINGEYDKNGKLSKINASYFPNSKSGEDTSGLKPKGTLHWVDSRTAKNATIRLYNRLFTIPNPSADDTVDFLTYYNENSLQQIDNAYMEASLVDAKIGQSYQFLRHGYFTVDKDSTETNKVFNMTVSLKESYKPKQ